MCADIGPLPLFACRCCSMYAAILHHTISMFTTSSLPTLTLCSPSRGHLPESRHQGTGTDVPVCARTPLSPRMAVVQLSLAVSFYIRYRDDKLDLPSPKNCSLRSSDTVKVGLGSGCCRSICWACRNDQGQIHTALQRFSSPSTKL